MRWNIGMVGGSRSSTSNGTAARVRNLCERVAVQIELGPETGRSARWVPGGRESVRVEGRAQPFHEGIEAGLLQDAVQPFWEGGRGAPTVAAVAEEAGLNEASVELALEILAGVTGYALRRP